MAQSDKTQDLDNFDYGIIRKKARQIIGSAGFRRQDREDVEQELLLRVLKALKTFDPKRGHRKAFVTTVVERDAAKIRRYGKAQKRDPRRIRSLNVIVAVTDDGPVELAETITDREYNARRCREPRSPEELADLAMDVADLLAALPEGTAELAERLKVESKSEVAQAMGIPRTTFSDRVRQVRMRNENTGLREYL